MRIINTIYRNYNHLYWCRTQSKDFISCSFSVAIHVYQDMYAISIDAICSFSVARNGGQVYEVFCISLNLLPKTGLIISCKSIAEDLKK